LRRNNYEGKNRKKILLGEGKEREQEMKRIK
jgi:hypothetical protein